VALFFRKRATLEHPYFGKLTSISRGTWEAELTIPGKVERLGLVIPAPVESGPSAGQEAFCRALLSDLDTLFERCRPVFAGAFEEWTSRPFPSGWREQFELVGLGLPAGGDEREPWDVTYFVDGASHYFTAWFEDGSASYLTVDG
jgi:hypothetical protein